MSKIELVRESKQELPAIRKYVTALILHTQRCTALGKWYCEVKVGVQTMLSSIHCLSRLFTHRMPLAT